MDLYEPTRAAAESGATQQSAPEVAATEHLAAEVVASEVVAATWICIRDGRLLVVRPAGQDAFYLPGGTPEPGESLPQTVAREVAEETGITVDPDSLAPLLEITADAYGRPGTRVRLVAYQTDPIGVSGSTGVTGVTGVTQEPRASAEIEEIGWFTGADSARCAPAVQLALRQLHERGLLPPAPTPTPM